VNARFLVPGRYAPGDRIDVPGDEAEHLTRVLRLRAGDPVRIFDGRGHEFDGTVAATTKTTASVVIGEPVAPLPEPRVAMTLAHAVLKGDRMDAVIRDAVMMGVAAVQPIVSARSEVTRNTLDRSNRIDRWTRIAASSAKQCGRAVLPPILDARSLDDVIDALATLALPQPALMLVEPSVAHQAQSLTELDAAAPREATVLIGPEGGWAPDEIERAGAVCRLVRLGGRTLRADAMSTIAIAALFTRWGEF
jgi:16S rRNA (uracil1498-N3)-methyltransferase